MSDLVEEVDSRYLPVELKNDLPEGFVQSEVGVIPKDWVVCSLGSIGKFKNGINKGAEDFGFGHRFVNLLDVFGKPSISGSEHLGLINSSELDKKEYSMKKGDVLFIRSSVKPSGVGLTTVLKGDLEETVFSGFLIRFRSAEILEDGFKEFCFYEEGFRNRVIAGSTVSANTNINQDVLKSLRIGIPPRVKEQRAIANALSDIDALISEQEKLIAKKQAIKTATMQQLLTGRTRLPQFALREDGSVKGYRQSELGEVPEDWELVRFGDVITTLKGGANLSPSDFTNTGVPVIPKGAVTWGTRLKISTDDQQFCRNATSGKFLSSTIDESYTIIVLRDLVPSGPNIGLVVKIDEPDNYILAQGVYGFKLRNGYCSRYFAQLSNGRGYRKIMKSILVGSTQVHIRSSSLKDTKFPFPSSVTEQTKIAGILDDMDDVILGLQVRLNKTRQIKQGMMQELLTGKTRLVKPEQSQ